MILRQPSIIASALFVKPIDSIELSISYLVCFDAHAAGDEFLSFPLSAWERKPQHW